MTSSQSLVWSLELRKKDGLLGRREHSHWLMSRKLVAHGFLKELGKPDVAKSASVAAMGQMSLLNIVAYSVPSCINIFDLFRATKELFGWNIH